MWKNNLILLFHCLICIYLTISERNMSHFSDYMDGVPVKISEKYKKPPPIEIPRSVEECIARAQRVVDSIDYCFTFEEKVLAKLAELQSAKETKRNERNHRLQLLEEEKQKKLDALAALEAEEKLKQLSVSEVSYPSTEEISEMSPDDKHDNDCDNTTPTQEVRSKTPEVSANNDLSYPTCSTIPEYQPSILQPIQVKPNYVQNNLLDDPDPLREYRMKSQIHIPQYNSGYSKHNVESLTYKDFENDNSSPFDNVELKTINDMELLAQVLQSGQQSSTSCYPQSYVPAENYMMPNCASQAQIDNMTPVMYGPNYMDQPIQGPVMYQQYPVNGYYVPETCDNNIPVDNVNMFLPNVQYYVPNQYPIDQNYYNNQQMIKPDITNISNESTYMPYYYNYPQMPMQFQPQYNNIEPQTTQVMENPIHNQNVMNTPAELAQSNVATPVKSRSRSVPDIIRELDEEIVLAKNRVKERSYNASPAPKQPQPSSSRDTPRVKRRESLPNPFDKLPPNLQDMCRKIHGMGFPLDRVARVCQLLGDSDKKVIEGLLMIDELLDLGFPEGKVTTMLAKNRFSKEKALEELVP